MKMNYKYCPVALFLFMVTSCNHVSDKKNTLGEDKLLSLNEEYHNSEVREAVNPDTLIVLEEEYPIEMNAYKDLLCILMAKSDSCIYLFDKQSGKLLSRMGTIGQGPEDMISPEFVKNNYAIQGGDKGMMLYDLNANHQFFLNSTDSLNSFSDLDELYYGVAGLNIGLDYAVGRQLRGEPSLFQIMNLNTREVNAVGLYPVLPEEVTKPIQDKLGYLYSVNTLCNFDKNRILAGHYFFDLLQVYDLNGALQKTIYLGASQNAVEQCSSMLKGEDYIGYSQCHATNAYCYFRRDLVDGKTREIKGNQIIQVDWDGNITSILEFKNRQTSGFCVENDRYLYCIERIIKDEEEIYAVLRYSIHE